MLMKRIIPCLDVKDGRVVKGVRFQGLRDGGADPVELARRYLYRRRRRAGFLDITAGLEGRRTVGELVAKTARTVFVPLTVGGGICSVADARRLLRSGCDKVAVNTAAVRRPELLSELADGIRTPVCGLAVDALRTETGYRVVVDAGRTVTELELTDWLRRGQALGVGEFCSPSSTPTADRKGTTWRAFGEAGAVCRVPVIASGGMGTAAHMVDAVAAGADALLAASVFHYGRYTVRSLARLSRRGVEVSHADPEHRSDGRPSRPACGRARQGVGTGATSKSWPADSACTAGIAVIDLDAALGRGDNGELVRQLCRIARCRVGGGIATSGTPPNCSAPGRARLIIGTAAEEALLTRLPRDRVLVAVDR